MEITTVSGAGVRPWIPALARLRVAVFREFPYLYEGSEEYERGYLDIYVRSPRRVQVLAEEGGEAVGCGTGQPLVDEGEVFQRPFLRQGADLGQVFYFGESVLLPAWRGRGIGHRFFDERERFALSLGGFRLTTFCAVRRPEGHPRRPAGHVPHDVFWTKRGYVRRPELTTELEWPEIGSSASTAKPMVFWTHAW